MEIPFRRLPKLYQKPEACSSPVKKLREKKRCVAHAKGNIHVPEEADRKMLHGMVVMKGKLAASLLKTAHSDTHFIPLPPPAATTITHEQHIQCCEDVTRYLTKVFMTKLKEYSIPNKVHKPPSLSLPTITDGMLERTSGSQTLRPYTAPSHKKSSTRSYKRESCLPPPVDNEADNSKIHSKIQQPMNNIARLEEKKRKLMTAINEKRPGMKLVQDGGINEGPDLLDKNHNNDNCEDDAAVAATSPRYLKLPRSPRTPRKPSTSKSPSDGRMSAFTRVGNVVKPLKRMTCVGQKSINNSNTNTTKIKEKPNNTESGLGIGDMLSSSNPTGQFVDMIKNKHLAEATQYVLPKTQKGNIEKVQEFKQGVRDLLDELGVLEEKLMKGIQKRCRQTAHNIGARYGNEPQQPPKERDTVVVLHEHEWKEARVVQVNKGCPIVQVGKEGIFEKTTIPYMGKLVICTDKDLESTERQNLLDFEACKKITAIKHEIENTQGYRELLQRNEQAREQRDSMTKHMVANHMERKHVLHLQLQTLANQITQTKKQHNEFKAEEVRLEVAILKTKNEVKEHEKDIRNLKLKTNRMKYKGKYKKMLKAMLEETAPDEVGDLLGLHDVGVQHDLQEMVGLKSKVFFQNKEKVIQEEIENLKECAQELAEFNFELESEITCSQCLNIARDMVMMWPCGHSFCETCAATMETNIYAPVECWRCADCNQMSAFESVPNQSITNLSTKWSVKESGHRDLTVAIMAFEAELAAINRKCIAPLKH